MYLSEQEPIAKLKKDKILLSLSGWFKTEVEKADRYEIWSSSFADKGEDFNEFVLFADNVEIYRIRKAGY